MNIITLMVDSLRCDYLGCYGNDWIQTPDIDQLAHDGIIFHKFYPECLPTIPVRRALFTGQRIFPVKEWKPSKTQEVIIPGWQPIREGITTLAEILSDAGFKSALISDTYHLFKPGMNFHRGFSTFQWIRGQEFDRFTEVSDSEVQRSVDAHLPPSLHGSERVKDLYRYLKNIQSRKYEEDYFAPKVIRRGIQWLESNYKRDNLFLWLDLFDPHEPWDTPDYYTNMYDPNYKGKKLIWPKAGSIDPLSKEELKHIRALYAGEVTMVDRWIGHLLKKLEDLKLMDNTLILLLSDHGLPLGDHGVILKGYSHLYEELLHAPLIINHPEGEQGETSALVQTPDIFATILDFLEIEPPKLSEGKSLLPLFTNVDMNFRDYAYSGFYERTSITDGKWKLLDTLRKQHYPFLEYEPLKEKLHPMEKPELYNLHEDPNETNNLYEVNRKKAKELHSNLEEFIKQRSQ